jgi:hypothetical protein
MVTFAPPSALLSFPRISAVAWSAGSEGVAPDIAIDVPLAFRSALRTAASPALLPYVISAAAKAVVRATVAITAAKTTRWTAIRRNATGTLDRRTGSTRM